MLAKRAVVAALVSGLAALFGCGDGGVDYYNQQRGADGGPAALDIAGSYLVTPDAFGFNTFTIYQSGNTLTALDNGGGTWTGTLSNVMTEERTGAGGTMIIAWRGDVTLTGKNAVGDDLSLSGVVEITFSPAGNIVQITTEYQNVSIGLTGQLLLTQTSALPGGAPGTGGDASGRENQ